MELSTSVLTLPETGSLGLSERAKAFVFDDPNSRRLLEQIQKVAGGDRPVLINGGPGTGRELVARHLHALGLRPSGPFLAVNCGAFPKDAVAAELFGLEKRVARGIMTSRPGWLEAAHGGTLYLDAIGDLALETQGRLLRTLQEHQVMRLGARRNRSFDVRVVAASDVELEDAVKAGHFRRDLLRFLAGAVLVVPPLRERPGDILPLARHFLHVYQRRIGIGARELDDGAAARLLQHAWPGNIRELETVIHHALLRCHGHFITETDLRLGPAQEAVPSVEPRAVLERALLELLAASPPNLRDLVDETLLRAAYRHCQHNQLKTARLLGVSRNVVRARLIQYGEIAGVVRRTQGASEGARAAAPLHGVVRIGYQRVGLLKVVRARGSLAARFRELGFEIEWAHYPSGIRLVDAFRSGKLDLGVVGEGPPIFAHAAEVPVVYVAAEPSAPEAEAIIVRRDSPIFHVRELKAKRVAVVRGSSAHYLLIRALEEAGVEYADIALKFAFQDAARAAFQSGDIDAWALGDPGLAEVQQSMPTRVLRDARGLAPNSAYYLASQAFAEAQPELLEVVRVELESVARWAAQNVDEVAGAYAVRLGMQREALGLSLKRGIGRRLRQPELMASQQRIADAFFRLKIIPRGVSLAGVRWAPDNSNAHDAEYEDAAPEPERPAAHAASAL